MYLIRFKESDFDLIAVKELFYIPHRQEAIQVAEELNEFVQEILGKCRKDGILGCVFIPQLDVMIVSTNSICSVEAIELKRFEPLQELTYEHLLG